MGRGEAEKLLGKTDASSIVVDEIAGYLISMILVPSGWGSDCRVLPFQAVRCHQALAAQMAAGSAWGLGVVLDDVGAGIYTNIVLQIGWYFLARG